MGFKLGKKSQQKLIGVDEQLVRVVQTAITKSKIDFAVIEGLRTVDRQRELVAKGASQTMKSKHIEGRAIDLMAFLDSRPSWELTLYDDIADAMAEAARKEGVSIRWGAAWHIDNIAGWNGTMEDAMNSYIDLRRSEGKRPFIDGPHFELS
jgi:peptidoglycan L-alanyl-D-glutamate endopeptidase CwlK